MSNFGIKNDANMAEICFAEVTEQVAEVTEPVEELVNEAVAEEVAEIKVSGVKDVTGLIEKIKSLITDNPMAVSEIREATANYFVGIISKHSAMAARQISAIITKLLPKIDGVICKDKKYYIPSQNNTEPTEAELIQKQIEELQKKLEHLTKPVVDKLVATPTINTEFVPKPVFNDITAELDTTTAKAEKAKVEQEQTKAQIKEQKNKSTTKTKKVDMFKSKKSLAEITREFFFCNLKRIEVFEKYNNTITGLKNALTSLEHIEKYEWTLASIKGQKVKVYGSSRWSEEELREKIDAQKSAIQNYEYEKQTMMNAISKHTDSNRWDGRWVWNFLDSVTISAISGAKDWDTVKEAIRSWCGAYNLEIANTNLENDLIKATSWNTLQKKLVTSNGMKVMSFNGKKSLENYYGVIYEYSVLAGTIKTVDIPSLVREKYNKNNFKK